MKPAQTKSSNPTTPHLKSLSRLIERSLQRILPKASSPPQLMHTAMRYCVFSDGKRFRPLLCLAACEAVGRPASVAVPVACAVELIHTYSLVHDDLPAMDNALTRRGKPSCHRRFGEGTAILVGDALLTYAFEVLGRNGVPNRGMIARTVSQACGTTGLIGGQTLDLAAMQRPRATPASTWRQIAQWKTGALITASVIAGGLAGRATPKQLQRLRKYGHNIGLAFQFIDDLHDREGLARVLGTRVARQQAQQLITQALHAVESFGTRGQGLHDLAQWLAFTA